MTDISLIHSLPVVPRVHLQVAVRFALYGIVLTRRSGKTVEVADYDSRMHAGSVLFGLEPEPAQAALEHFLRRLNDAARRGLVTFYGRRTYKLSSVDPSRISGG